MATSISISHKHGTRRAVRQNSQRDLDDSSSALPSASNSLSLFKSLFNDASPSVCGQNLKTTVNKQKQSATNSISTPSRSSSEMKRVKSSKPTASSMKIPSKRKDKSNDSTSAATTPTSSDLSTFSISPTADQSLSKKKASTSISTSSKTASVLPAKNNPVPKTLTTTNTIGLKKTSASTITITKTPVGNSLIQDFQKKLKNRDDTIKDLKKKIEERDKTIANLSESSMTIPTEPLVIDWIDHLYAMVHQNKIRDQINYEDYAERLSMDVDTLKNCINEKDRVKTAREIVRNFPDYQEIIHMDNAWILISKEQINIVLEFIEKQFGPSMSKTDNVIRTSLSTMVRSASWKVRGDACVVHSGGNSTELSGQDDGQNQEENEEEE